MLFKLVFLQIAFISLILNFENWNKYLDYNTPDRRTYDNELS